MDKAKISAIYNRGSGTEITVQGNSLQVGALITEIISSVLKVNDNAALASILTAIELSDKENELYEKLEEAIKFRKARIYD